MKKIFRMANAELNKIFMRPSMFVLSTVLVVALVLSFFLFKPTSINTKYTHELNSIAAIHLRFEGEYESIEEQLISAKKAIDEYIASESNTSNNNSLAHLQNLFQTAKNQFYNQLYVAVVEMPKNNPYPSASDLAEVSYEFEIFKECIEDIKTYILDNVKNKEVNFFVTTGQLDRIYNTVKNLGETIPSENQLKDFTTQAIIDRINVMEESFDLDALNVEVSKIKQIKINHDDLNKLLDLYYTPNMTEQTNGGITTYTHTGKLKELYDNVSTYYYDNKDSAEKEDLTTMNEHIAKFYDYVQINKTLINNKFELLRIGNKTDDEIVNYNGFSGVSIYNLKLGITTSQYFLDNNTFGYEYLNAFNFNVNSGTQTNCYDFTFYAMQILSCLIVLFVIFFASGMISGEQNSGTLKMTAIRPYTRNKIYSGKFIACFNVALILLLVSFVASMAIGIATSGFTTQSALIVINASAVMVVNPIVLMLFYFASILIDVVFYIALSIFISMLIKPTTISTAITASIFIASTIITGTTTASWIRFIPTTHLGLYKYFTTSNPGMFSFSIVPGVNMITSIIVIVASILAFDLFGRFLFTHRSIDKW